LARLLSHHWLHNLSGNKQSFPQGTPGPQQPPTERRILTRPSGKPWGRLPELPSLQGLPMRYPPPSCGACPAPANATQRRAPPGSGAALWRGSRGALGGTEEPCARWGGAKRPFGFPLRLHRMESDILPCAASGARASTACRFPQKHASLREADLMKRGSPNADITQK
jgi:hypothetical protein